MMNLKTPARQTNPDPQRLFQQTSIKSLVQSRVVEQMSQDLSDDSNHSTKIEAAGSDIADHNMGLPTIILLHAENGLSLGANNAG